MKLLLVAPQATAAGSRAWILVKEDRFQPKIERDSAFGSSHFASGGVPVSSLALRWTSRLVSESWSSTSHTASEAGGIAPAHSEEHWVRSRSLHAPVCCQYCGFPVASFVLPVLLNDEWVKKAHGRNK